MSGNTVLSDTTSVVSSVFGFLFSVVSFVLFFGLLFWLLSLLFRRYDRSPAFDSGSETVTTVTTTTSDEPEDVPDFDNRKAKNLFLAVNAAWDKADKDALRVLLSGDLAEEFADNLDSFESSGRRDRVTDLILDSIEFLGSNVRAGIVRHAFRVKYSAKFYVVDRSGAVVEGDNLNPENAVEKWYVAESDSSFGYELVGIER